MGHCSLGPLCYLNRPEVWFPFGMVALVVLAGLFFARGKLTGAKVLAIAVAFFGVVIVVNVVMATRAVGTFPGLEVDNSYVASQTFDADRAAQERLGWSVEPSYDGSHINFIVRDKGGLPARVSKLKVLIGRTTMSKDDQTPELTYAGGIWSAPLTLAPGAWLIQFDATAADGTAFHQRLDFMVDG